MKNNKAILTIILAVLAVSCLFFACGEQNARTGIKVVYELEGGIYKNSTQAVEIRYTKKDDAGNDVEADEIKIKSLDDMGLGSVIKQGYRIEGWYKTKTVNGDEVTYSDKWNFETDLAGKDGVTLYARWVIKAIYKYSVGYYDGDKFVEVGSYETEAGVPFKESFVKKQVLAAADQYDGHTATGEFFTDKDLTQKFDENFAFEESNESQTKIVVAKYIEGRYKIINAVADLTAAVDSDDDAYQGKALYIMNDLDFGGGALDMPYLFETDEVKGVRFTGIMGANGVKTVSNFKIATNGKYSQEDYDGNEIGTVRASVFGDLSGVTIKDLNLEKVVFEIAADNSDYMKKVVVAPLCGSAEKCVFENVKVEITEYKVRLLINDPAFEESKTGNVWNVLFKDKGENQIKNCSATVAKREEAIF